MKPSVRTDQILCARHYPKNGDHEAKEILLGLPSELITKATHTNCKRQERKAWKVMVEPNLD